MVFDGGEVVLVREEERKQEEVVKEMRHGQELAGA